MGEIYSRFSNCGREEGRAGQQRLMRRQERLVCTSPHDDLNDGRLEETEVEVGLVDFSRVELNMLFEKKIHGDAPKAREELTPQRWLSAAAPGSCHRRPQSPLFLH